jgi:hypothetical protein
MFMAAPGIYIPPETHFLPILNRTERMHGYVNTAAGFEQFLRELMDICSRNEIPVDREQLERELRAACHDRAMLFDTFLSHIQSRRTDCRRIGEKSPVHIRCVPELIEIFPSARIINVIRDGRDVALSQEEAFHWNTLQAALSWRRDQRLHARYRETLPATSYTQVHYEDLVTEPEPQLRRLCDFLEEPFDAAMLSPHERLEDGFAPRETHKAQTRQPVTSSRIGRYRTKLSRSKISLFQSLAGAELIANGYELEPVSQMLGYLLGIQQLPRLLLFKTVLGQHLKKTA